MKAGRTARNHDAAAGSTAPRNMISSPADWIGVDRITTASSATVVPLKPKPTHPVASGATAATTAVPAATSTTEPAQ